MILHSENKNKYIALFTLVFITTSIIVWQYIKINPFDVANNKEGDNTFQVVGESLVETFSEIGESWNMAKDLAIDSQEDIEGEFQRQQLLEETKKYLEEKNNTEEDSVEELEDNNQEDA